MSNFERQMFKKMIESPLKDVINEDGLRLYQAMTKTFGESRAELGIRAVGMHQIEILLHRDAYTAPEGKLHPHYVLRHNNGEFIWTISFNTQVCDVYFLSQFFDVQDRPQIVSRLETCFLPSQESATKFANALGGLLMCRAFMMGTKGVYPITKQIIRDGAYPDTILVPSRYPRLNVAAADSYQRSQLGPIVDRLVSHFPDRRRNYWRQVFRHIADGGDGNARQERNGPRLSKDDVQKTIDALKGRSQTQAAIKLNLTERGLKKRLAQLKDQGYL